ncbi:MAG: glycopeptide antibiotics resistance protein [Clostridia bacterium]|jgi:glycopeptide antibiotics resistance protein|nr:glycopeptide antibiotics resistance protein [Clostridia bacterium]
MQRKGAVKINRIGLSVLFAYVAFISWRLFFFAYSNNYRGQMTSLSYNLVPMKTISNYLLHSGRISFDIWIYNLAGNVAAFMPLGFLLPLSFKGFSGGKTMAASFTLILSAEVLQLVSRRGVFDVDDLLLNMLGTMIGYCIYKLLCILFKGRR